MEHHLGSAQGTGPPPVPQESTASIHQASFAWWAVITNALPPPRRARALGTAPKPQAEGQTGDGPGGRHKGGFKAFVALKSPSLDARKHSNGLCRHLALWSGTPGSVAVDLTTHSTSPHPIAPSLGPPDNTPPQHPTEMVLQSAQGRVESGAVTFQSVIFDREA